MAAIHDEEPKMEQEERLPSEQYSFVQEIVKDEQSSRKSVKDLILRTAAKGAVFGLVAGLVFGVVYPIVSRVGREQSAVSIPKDEEVSLEEKESKELTVEDYKEMNQAMNQVAQDASRCVVEITATYPSEANREDQMVTGFIFWDDTSNILILAPSRIYKDAKQLKVTFSNEKSYELTLKKKDGNLGLAVFAVDKAVLDESTKSQMKIAVLGNSNLVQKGETVINIGNQFGYAGSLGFGIISSVDKKVELADRACRLLLTDISASDEGSGVLINTEGEIIGISDQKIADTSSDQLVKAYAISDIKECIERLSNGKSIPYLGIKVAEVTEEMVEEQGMPSGLYVKEVEADSPAMKAGIQSGDIITKINQTEMESVLGYYKKLMEFDLGRVVQIQCQRQGAKEYVTLDLSAMVGSKE